MGLSIIGNWSETGKGNLLRSDNKKPRLRVQPGREEVYSYLAEKRNMIVFL